MARSPLDETLLSIDRKRKPTRQPQKTIFNRLLIALLFFGLSVGACGLFAIKNQMYAAWNQALGRFHWMVLVQGDQIQVDEVGRFLRQIDGVSDVGLISAEDTLQRLKDEANFSQGISYFEGNPFPPSWKVTWKSEVMSPAKMQEVLQDVRTFPGVLDVAFDSAALQDLHRFRMHWYQVKTVLALLMFAGVLFLAVLFGFFLFSTNFHKAQWGKIMAAICLDTFYCSLGFAAVLQFMGSLPWELLWGGVILSLSRQAWVSLSANKA